MPRRYYGKHRGTCVDDADPQQLGRIQVVVPDVHGTGTAPWALPCFPVTGAQGGFFAVPAPGASVWVEFEQGDPDRPIWVGGFHPPGEVPAAAAALAPGVSGLTLQTDRGHGLTISDAPGADGGIVIRSAGGATISVGDAGITVSNGLGATISLTGPLVDVNDGALQVI